MCIYIYIYIYTYTHILWFADFAHGGEYPHGSRRIPLLLSLALSFALIIFSSTVAIVA